MDDCYINEPFDSDYLSNEYQRLIEQWIVDLAVTYDFLRDKLDDILRVHQIILIFGILDHVNNSYYALIHILPAVLLD